MRLAQPVPDTCAALESDRAFWNTRIDRALATPDPVLSNRRVTDAHYQLSLALRAVLGTEAGANFHTWATWGSRKAGQTIRQEEAPYLGLYLWVIGCILGLAGTVLLPSPSPMVHGLMQLAGTLLGGWVPQLLIGHYRSRSSRLILAGNRTVLDDIGRQTARFVALFHEHPAPDPARLAIFLDGLRPGPTATGGQDLLRAAFTHYYQARHASCGMERDEHMVLGNLLAILHEHVRLQPYIEGAMPRLVQRLITRYLLSFTLGHQTLRVSEDVRPPDGVCLPGVASAELRAFLDRWDRTGGSGVGSHAANWADLRDRMAYICMLFRTAHYDPTLFTRPYSDGSSTDSFDGIKKLAPAWQAMPGDTGRSLHVRYRPCARS